MKFRKIISLSLVCCFIVVSSTGILSFVQDYTRLIATLHTVFGLFFTLGIFFHMFNNFRPLKNYARGSTGMIILLCTLLVIVAGYFQRKPIQAFMNLGARLKATTRNTQKDRNYEVLEMDMRKDIQLNIDLLRGEHYWHPQMAIWVEDSLGNYVKTIFVSKATAKGLFFGGRSRENFKTADQNTRKKGAYRRVNALPVWSHKRGIKYKDGGYVPTREQPLPDALSGATFNGSFQLYGSLDTLQTFTLCLEINVAFDDNEYYSEFDFPDDEVFHNGTGQLGQPSLIYKANIDMADGKDYYLMDLMGHGHHSAAHGRIHTEMQTITTARDIVERILIGVKQKVRNKV